MKHIRNRVFLQILLPTVIIFLLLVGGGLYYVNRSYEEQVITRKSQELNRASRAIHNWLVARISTLIQISHTPMLAGEQRGQIIAFLRDEQTRLSFVFETLYFIEPDGRYHSTHDETGSMTDLDFLADFREGSKRFFYTAPLLRDPRFNNSILIAAPVFEGGQYAGAVAATIPLQVFSRMVGYFTVEEFDSFMMVNPRSIIIVHSDSSMIGKSERGEYGQSFFTDTRWHNRMVFVSVLRTTWKLVAFSSMENLLQPVRQINRIIVIFFVLIIAIIGFVSLAVSHRVARPINRLTEGVHAIMEGNYRQRLSLSTRDELQELAEAFNRLSERLVRLRTEDRFAFLGHISARVAHEIRKPLHVIQLAVQQLQQSEENRERYLRMIAGEVGNADRFVGEILNFARPEALNLSRYSLSELLEKIYRKFELLAAEREVELVYRVEAQDIHPFYLDIIKMEQAISNLLQNALEALDGCPPPRRISMSLTRSEREAVITIEDNGPGFPDEEIDKLLDPYYTTKSGGTGLGMSISYRILSAHLARLSLENSPEHHARVAVRIPL